MNANPRFRRLPPPDIALSLASMTDVVFLLLIFFMLTSPMVLSAALPEIKPPETREPRPVGKASDRISIDRENRLAMNGATLGVAELDARLREVRARTERIAVLADDACDLGVAVRVMEACRAAGLAVDVYATPVSDSSKETAKNRD